MCAAAPEPDLETELLQKVAVVSGAGIQQVNGHYYFSRILNDSAVFIKPPFVFKYERTNLNLYRCKMTNGNYCWFISHVTEGKDPGTANDIDYYSAPSPYSERNKNSNDMLPPVTGWSPAGAQHHGSVPTVRIVDKDSVESAPIVIDTDGHLERVGSMEALDDEDDALDREGGLDISYNDSLMDDVYGYTPVDESLDQSMDQSID